MADLSSFAELIRKGKEEALLKKQQESAAKEAEVVPLLGDLFKTVAKAKQIEEKRKAVVQKVDELEANQVTEDDIQEIVSDKITEVATETEKKLAAAVKKLQDDIAKLKRHVDSRPTTVSSGSGEVKILRMDDIDVSNLSNGRMIVWNSEAKKFRFADVPVASNLGRPFNLVTNNYTVTSNDYYIGVQSTNTQISITVPNTFVDGKEFVIKDESSNASLLPIKLIGTIDNDSNGLTIAIDNGSVSLIYRNGWRVI